MLTLCVFGSWDDIQQGKKIKISKTGKLNIYIAVDISPSMDKQSISAAISVTQTLIEKVRNVASCWTLLAFSDTKRWFIRTKNSQNFTTLQQMYGIYFRKIPKWRATLCDLLSPQIASFVVTPNYEIILFDRDIFEVVNIMDFRSGKISLETTMDKLKRFNIDGETKTSTYGLKKSLNIYVCASVF